MRFSTWMPAAVVAVAAMSSGVVFASGKDEPKPIVSVPKSWDAAVAEAKKLNLPIVIHSHGFY